MWSAGGRRLSLVKQEQVGICCSDRFANPPANRKQAQGISPQEKDSFIGLDPIDDVSLLLGKE